MSKTDNPENTKVNERVNKLCVSTRGLTNKDISALSYIVTKTSRIVAVTLMLADVLDANNELKIELQKSSIGLVKDASVSAQSLESRAALTRGLLRVVALLDVAQKAGLLSKMNTETLSDEIVSFSEFLNTVEWHTGRRYIDESYFRSEIPRDVFSPEPIITKSETTYRHERDIREPHAMIRNYERDQYTGFAKKDTDVHERVQYKERVQEIQKDRRATILGLVQKKDRITVKDVANVIKDCSEKTIQRELLALVRQGVLKKEGERRWSTYSMA